MNIKKVVVIGSGTMGSGIAAHLCNANIPVTLLDLTTEISEKARNRIFKSKPPLLLDKTQINNIKDIPNEFTITLPFGDYVVRNDSGVWNKYELDTNRLVTDNITELLDELNVVSKWSFNLSVLKNNIGGIGPGNLMIAFARPETGKTTFLASEMTHMVSQTDGDILWFNNEEQGKKVAVRCFQALFGLTNKELFDDKENNANEYKQKVGSRIKIYDYEDSSSTSRIESIIKETNPSLIIFDQIDKVRGFKSDRYDLELKKLYQWAREMAKIYAPVIAVSQAGGTGEGKVWLQTRKIQPLLGFLNAFRPSKNN